MDLINALYKEYIDNKYIFTSCENHIIIMEKTDKTVIIPVIKELIDVNKPYAQYHGIKLKIILIFNKADPYKLLSHIDKYIMNNIINSNCYLNMERAYYQDLHIENGLSVKWHKNGQKQYEESYVNGKRHGISILSYNNGIIYEKGNYINDQSNGYFQYWHENGNIWGEGTYVDNKKNGLWKNYHYNGQLHTEGHYTNGRETGMWKIWNVTGNLIKEVVY